MDDMPPPQVPDTVRLQPINMAMFAEASGTLEVARSITIDGPEMYSLAADQLKDIKSLAKRLDDDRKAITKPLDAAKAAVMNLFRGPVQFCADAEATIKQSMLGYDNEQRRLQQEAERKAREAAEAERRRIAEVARKQAEAEAAAARAEAEKRAAAAREAAERQAAIDRAEAEKRAAELKAKGDAEAAERAEREAVEKAERVKAESEAKAKADAEAAEHDAARRAAEIEQAAQMEAEQVAVYAPMAEQTKASGVSYRETWKAEVTDLDALIAAAAAGNAMARGCICADEKAINGQARALKQNFKVPGVRVFAERGVSARRV